MTISTIITVYNLEKYIEETLQSVFSQTRQPDEIIVVDDCSTDDSAEILRKYSDKIKYIRMPQNSGVLMAFIRGIEESISDIVTFLDGDDIWYPNKIEEVEKAFAENEDRILVTHDYECINGKGENRPYTSDPTHFNMLRIFEEASSLEEMDKLLRNSMLSYKGVWLGSAFSLRRKYLDIAGFKKLMLKMPGSNLSHQDQPIAAYVVLQNREKQMYFINQILFKYRVFGMNSSGVSYDVSSALRTIERSKATLMRTSHLVSQYPELIEESRCQNMRLLDVEYMQTLYAEGLIKALPKFFKLSTNFWNREKFSKELKRMVGVAVLGPERFLRLKSK